MSRCLLTAAVVLVAASCGFAADKSKPREPQYKFETIVIPAADAHEHVRKTFSVKAAVDYLERGSKAWSGARKCVACHTNGSYLVIRPSLTKQLGAPAKEHREFFVAQYDDMKKKGGAVLRAGLRPTQMAYIAAGLAEWDRHVTGKLSKETDAALRLMLSLQSKDGSQRNLNCWPPHESSNYHGATVVATAVATAPGFEKSLDPKKDKAVLQKIAGVRNYLKKTAPPHDYARVLLLWTATRMDGLVDAKQKQELIATLWKHQRTDGGWSIRTFATPEKWGNGSRAKKLRAEEEFTDPPSDGHMTGLAVMVLRDAGVPASDPRIQKAVAWLKSHQRESGRWWTRSLNTDRFHFITYTGTLYPLAALAKCGELPANSGE
jgi:squalene-hopene/tetraprenyl-beta-curcumene cyclase